MPKENQEKYLKIALIIIIITTIVTIWRLGILDNLTLESFQNNRIIYEEFVLKNWVLSATFYFLSYVLIVAFSLPGATIMTLGGGFLFGLWAIPLVILSSNIGDGLAFLASRYLFGTALQKKYTKQLARLNKDLEENGANYFITVSLIPIFPFFLINLLGGLTKVKFWTFFWTTAIGTLPAIIIYVYAGSKLAEIKSTKDIISTEIFSVLFILGLMYLIPLILKKLRSKN
jgi:uncharacterized membrane protein YdjX (TVP38/TMEM64 family)